MCDQQNLSKNETKIGIVVDIVEEILGFKMRACENIREVIMHMPLCQ